MTISHLIHFKLQIFHLISF